MDNKHAGEGKNGQPYNFDYYMKKFRISMPEVKISLREIRYGTAKELEDYLKLKYKS